MPATRRSVFGLGLALALALALAGCAASTPAPAESPAPPPLTQDRVTALISEIATLRGLPQRAPVPVELLDEAAFHASLRARTEQRPTASDIEAQKAFHLAFDLLPEASAEGGARPSTTREVLDEQVRGYYDHENKRIVVRASHPKNAAEAQKERAILAHEIEHALQDQNFGRPDENMRGAMSEDALLAYTAVLEGDAMLTMFAYLAAERGVPFQRMVRKTADLMRDLPAERFAGEGDSALFRALPIVRERLLFRYHAGAAMAAELYRAGGLDLVNRWFQDPPVSTEQILHPEKYMQGEAPAEIRPPDPPPGMRALGEGTLGELSLRVVLERCSRIAHLAAEGWGGDRYTLAAGPAGALALLWATAWDSERDAAEFVGAMNERPGCMRASSLLGATIDGSLLVRQQGRNVAVVRGLSGDTAEAALRALLVLPQPARNTRPPLPIALLPRDPLPARELGVFMGQDYFSRYLGIAGRVPLGVNALIGYQGTEIRINRPGELLIGGLILSDLVTTPRFVEKLFADIASGLARGADGKTLIPAGGSQIVTPLGRALERRWTVEETRLSIRAILIPICGDTGSLVFLQSFDDPTAQATLDAWMGSFRWNTNVKPPVCEAFDPR